MMKFLLFFFLLYSYSLSANSVSSVEKSFFVAQVSDEELEEEFASSDSEDEEALDEELKSPPNEEDFEEVEDEDEELEKEFDEDEDEEDIDEDEDDLDEEDLDEEGEEVEEVEEGEVDSELEDREVEDEEELDEELEKEFEGEAPADEESDAELEQEFESSEEDEESPGDLELEEVEDEEEEQDEELEQEAPTEQEAPGDEESDAELNVITNIRYVSEKDQILIDSSQTPSYQVRKNDKNNQLIVEILQAKLAKDLEWPYILKDFNTNFGLIQADQKTEDSVRIVIQIKEGANFPNVETNETGEQVIIGFGDLSAVSEFSSGEVNSDLKKSEILPAKSLEDLYFGKVDFSGSPISFHVIDAPIKQVLRFISEESNLNMVIGQQVTGTVTLKLENVPWDQALYTLFKVNDLGYTREGNVITINPLSVIQARTKKLSEIARELKPFTPLVTEVIPVSYAKLSEVKSKVEAFLKKGQAHSGGQAAGGEVIIHEETNTFIIVDTKKNIKKVKKLVSYLDQAPKQVMIEARIVEAEESFTRNLGLNWSLGGSLPVSVSPSGLLDFLKGNFSGDYQMSSSGSLSLNLSHLPIVGDIRASLDIAETEGYVRVVSAPRIVSISGKQASITRNSPIQRIGAATIAPDGTQQRTVELLDVKISLEVTPVVTSAGSVFLQVNVTRDNPGASFGGGSTGGGIEGGEGGGSGGGGGVVTSRQAQTEVLVKNGHTIVIGGIYQYDENSEKQGIPFVSKIPVLNWLFNHRRTSGLKNELLVFLTPKVINLND